jgi:hypothetical protein
VADTILVDTVDAARDAAVDAADDSSDVGAHLGVVETDDRVATHTFACELPGYRGWVWEVAVVRAPRATAATVCEAHLVPADDALLAPPWVPYAERIRPGDLEPGMVIPFMAEDARIVPGYTVTDDDDADAVAIWEFGLGRERVLGPDGRDDASERWYGGSHGPTAPSALQATATCATCAFLVPLAGSMRGMFGACANEWSPSDGQVVSLDHGCGAHSETDVEKQGARWPADDPVIDTMDVDSVTLTEPEESQESDAPEKSDAPDEPEESAT